MDEGESIVHASGPLLEASTVRYVIDAAASTFVAQAFATGLLSSFGHDPRISIRSFQGEVSFTFIGLGIEGARMNLTIEADSLEIAGELDQISEKDKREIHRKMYEEVLETDRFPNVLYECSRISASGSGDRYWVALNGDLTLHGVTRPVPISARAVINGNSLRATGEFSVKQSEYEIAPVSAAAGAIRLKDEVKCVFDIVARKQQ